MKTILLSAFILIGGYASSQTSFSWYPNDTVVMTVDANAYTQIYIEQVNETGGTLNLEMEMIYSDVPAGWDGMICVYGYCLGTIPSNGTIQEMMPISGSTNGYVRWTVNPMGGEETAEVHARVYDKDNPTDGDTCVFIITGQSSAGIQDNNTSFNLYPNPADNVITLTNESDLDQVSFYSIDGQLIKQENIVTANQTFDITELPSGLYFVNGYKEGVLVGTRKITVE